jgi:hypothetical protein
MLRFRVVQPLSGGVSSRRARRLVPRGLILAVVLVVLGASSRARAEKLEVEDLVGDGSLSPATLRVISDAIRSAAMRRPDDSQLEVLGRAAGAGPRSACDLKRAAARSAQFLVCGEYARAEGSVLVTLRLLDLSGRLLATQTLEGPAAELLSKVDPAADRLLAVRWSARGAPPPPPAGGPGSPASARSQTELRAGCEKGDAWSCIEVARSYGIMKNPAQAHPWVRRACDLRNATATPAARMAG